MNVLKNLHSITVMLHVVDFELCCPSGLLFQTSGLCLKLAKADSGIQVVLELSGFGGPLSIRNSIVYYTYHVKSLKMNDLKNLQSFTVMLHVVDFELCCPSGKLSQTSYFC